MRQLADAGLGVAAFAKEFKRPASEITEIMERGGVTFEDFRRVLRSSSAEGGIFFQGMIAQSRTTAGLWSTLKSNFVDAAAALGDVIAEQLDLKGAMTSLISATSDFAKGIKGFAKAHPGLVKFGLIFAGLVVVVGPLLVAVGGFIALLGVLAPAAAVLGTTVGAVAGAFVALSAAFAAGTALLDLFKGFSFEKLGKGALDFVGKVFTSERSQTDVNVNLNAPKGAIQSVKSVTTGRISGLNVGVNMASAL